MLKCKMTACWNEHGGVVVHCYCERWPDVWVSASPKGWRQIVLVWLCEEKDVNDWVKHVTCFEMEGSFSRLAKKDIGWNPKEEL